MQYANVATFRLQLTNQRHHTTETAGRAVLDGADPVGVVQMNERYARDLRSFLRGGAAGNDEQQTNSGERRFSIHGHTLFFEFRRFCLMAAFNAIADSTAATIRP